MKYKVTCSVNITYVCCKIWRPSRPFPKPNCRLQRVQVEYTLKGKLESAPQSCQIWHLQL